MSVSVWQSKNSKVKIHTDVLVVGAGISGIGIAYWLEKLSKRKVLIIDSKQLGSGASGRNAGFISTGSLSLFSKMVKDHGIDKALEMKNFYKLNHELIKQEVNLGEAEYQPVGSMSLVFSQEEKETLLSYADILNQNGFSSNFQSESSVLSSLSMIKTSGGFLDNQDAQVHSLKLLHSLESQLRHKPLYHEQVYDIQEHSALTQNYDITFSDIVFATNAYSPLVLPELKDLIRPVRAQMMSLAPCPLVLKHNVYASKMLCYLRQTHSQEIVIGGFRTLEESTEVGFDDLLVTTKIQSAFESFIKEHLPSVPLVVNHRWAGIMGFTVDDSPLVGQLGPGRWILGGYTGHGMGKAFACSKALAEHMVAGSILPSFINVQRVLKP